MGSNEAAVEMHTEILYTAIIYSYCIYDLLSFPSNTRTIQQRRHLGNYDVLYDWVFSYYNSPVYKKRGVSDGRAGT